MVAPAAPEAVSLPHPVVFCPKSKTKTPAFGDVTLVAGSDFTTLWGGNICALSTPPGERTGTAAFQLASSTYEGVDQPGFSSRASYVSPLRMPSRTMGPLANF